jgi:hypothetical protein
MRWLMRWHAALDKYTFASHTYVPSISFGDFCSACMAKLASGIPRCCSFFAAKLRFWAAARDRGTNVNIR